MTAWAIAAALVITAGPALAQTPENLQLQVQPDPAGGARVQGGIDVPAPPSVVWVTMLDCREALRYVPKLKGCRVLEAGSGFDVREHVFDYGVLGRIRHVFRSDYTNERRIKVTRVSGDLKASEGEWRLEPLEGGRATRIRYSSRSQPKTPVPGPIARQAIRRDAPASLRGLRNAAIRRAGAAG